MSGPESAAPARRPQVGEIWREVDPRFDDRFVRIETVGLKIGVRRTVVCDGPSARWVSAPRSRASTASPDRFNGKRGGYEFVESAP